MEANWLQLSAYRFIINNAIKVVYVSAIVTIEWMTIFIGIGLRRIIRRHVILVSMSIRVSSSEEYVCKSVTEVPIEDGVDDRIQRRIAVSEPEDDGEQSTRDLHPGYRRDGIDGEEGEPAPDERGHDDTEYDDRPALLRPGRPPSGPVDGQAA